MVRKSDRSIICRGFLMIGKWSCVIPKNIQVVQISAVHLIHSKVEKRYKDKRTNKKTPHLTYCAQLV